MAELNAVQRFQPSCIVAISKNEAQVITDVCLVEKKEKKEWFLALQNLDTAAADLGNGSSRAAAGSTSQSKPLRGRIK